MNRVFCFSIIHVLFPVRIQRRPFVVIALNGRMSFLDRPLLLVEIILLNLAARATDNH